MHRTMHRFVWLEILIRLKPNSGLKNISVLCRQVRRSIAYIMDSEIDGIRRVNVEDNVNLRESILSGIALHIILLEMQNSICLEIFLAMAKLRACTNHLFTKNNLLKMSVAIQDSTELGSTFNITVTARQAVDIGRIGKRN